MYVKFSNVYYIFHVNASVEVAFFDMVAYLLSILIHFEFQITVYLIYHTSINGLIQNVFRVGVLSHSCAAGA